MAKREISELIVVLLDEDGKPKPVTRKLVREVRKLGEDLGREQRREAAQKILRTLEPASTPPQARTRSRNPVRTPK